MRSRRCSAKRSSGRRPRLDGLWPLSWWCSHRAGSPVAQSVAAFLLVQHLCSPRIIGAPNRWIGLMSGAAFGIYLVHRATLDVVAGWTGDLYANAAGAAIALHALLAFLGALVVTLLIQRVPYIRRVVG
jgi:surface polysaccharide O-acyltransferase-like enzyme